MQPDPLSGEWAGFEQNLKLAWEEQLIWSTSAMSSTMVPRSIDPSTPSSGFSVISLLMLGAKIQSQSNSLTIKELQLS